MRIILMVVFTIALTGCAVHRDQQVWGEGATLHPGWDRAGAGLIYAVSSPGVWGSMVASLAIQRGGWDQDVSGWAVEEAPVFGSPERASRWSDDLAATSELVRVGSALGAPHHQGEWFSQKMGGVLNGYLAYQTTRLATTTLKDEVSRERPNGANRASYPSGHTSTAAVHSTMAAEAFAYYSGGSKLRAGLQGGSYAIAAATGWARVEAGVHYPSDVLAGFALGHMVGRFFSYTFFGVAGDGGVVPELALLPGGASLRVTLRY